MNKFKVILISLILAVGLRASAQTVPTSITGTLYGLNGKPAAGSSLLFELKGCPGPAPTITGAPGRVVEMRKTVFADKTGRLNGQIFGNDTISCSGAYSSHYTVTVMNGSLKGASADYCISNSSPFNFNLATPCPTPPVPGNVVYVFSQKKTWSNLVPYLAYDVVSYNGSSYSALTPNTGVQPDTHPDTWMLLAQRGDQGPQGLQGLQGLMGPQGPQGIQGPIGLTGATGPTGAQGPAGYTPIRGVDYFDGATGPQGPLGPEGPMGPQGPKGDPGDAASGMDWIAVTNKPANFQADWNTTVINRPALFDGTWTSLTGKPTNFAYTNQANTFLARPTLQTSGGYGAGLWWATSDGTQRYIVGLASDLATSTLGIWPATAGAWKWTIDQSGNVVNSGNLTVGGTLAGNLNWSYIQNKPTIPAAQVQTDWNAISGMGQILNKPTTFAPSAHTHAVTNITDFPATMTPTDNSVTTAKLVDANVTTSKASVGLKTFTKEGTLLDPVATDSGRVLVIDPGKNITITRVFCAVKASTSVTINLLKQSEASLYGAGTQVLSSDLTCTTSGVNTTSFASASVPAHTPVMLKISSVVGTPDSLPFAIEYTIDAAQ